jgi:hypothetical protein
MTQDLTSVRPPFAVWVHDRVQRRLTAEVVRLEEELLKMDETSFFADQPNPIAACQVRETFHFNVMGPSFPADS